jgi:hypothetical protein
LLARLGQKDEGKIFLKNRNFLLVCFGRKDGDRRLEILKNRNFLPVRLSQKRRRQKMENLKKSKFFAGPPFLFVINVLFKKNSGPYGLPASPISKLAYQICI